MSTRLFRCPFAAAMGAVLLAAPVTYAADSDDARAVIEGLFDTLVATATIEPALDPDERYAALEPVVTEAYNLARMGEVAAGRSWSRWTETEREAFLDAFVRLSVTQHAVRFAGLHAESFELTDSLPLDDRPGYAVEVVFSRAADEDADADFLAYWLERDGDRWRIVNIERRGTSSEVSAMRSSYRAILAESGLEGLLADLEDQIAECYSERGCYRR